MSKSSSYLRWAVFSLSFILLELALIGYADEPLSQYIRTLDPSVINAFRAYTDLGKSLWYLWPSAIGGLVCFTLAMSPQLPMPKRDRFRSSAQLLGFFFVCVALSGVVTDIIKPLAGRARPVLLERDGFYGFHPFTAHAVYNSFPSGHATTAFAVALALTVIWPRGRYWFLAFAAILGLSRVMVNAHYLSDVLAGALVGTLTVFVMRQLFARFGVALPKRPSLK